MMLGKRSRPPMKRTTSMTEFTLDSNGGVYQPSDPNNPFNNGNTAGVDRRMLNSSASTAVTSPRPQRRYSADLAQAADFLTVCCLCKRRLIPGRDIYMYRGDSAFCSLECRQQQMVQDERKEKCPLASKKQAAAATVAAAGAQVAATGGTVAAV